EHNISKVESAAAVSRYVGKYMFKDTMRDTWPAKWKRVRYSENWPKLVSGTPDFQSVLRSPADWRKVAFVARAFLCESRVDYEIAVHHIGNVLPPGYGQY